MAVREAELVDATGVMATNGRPAEIEAPISKHGVVFATAEELGAKIDGPTTPLSSKLQTVADRWLADYKAELLAKTEEELDKLDAKERADRTRAGLSSITVHNYVSYDIAAFSPLQPGLNAGVGPHKIVASGQPMVLMALQWINPRSSIPDGFYIPPTTQLAGRQMRVRFDQLNLTTGVAGSSFNITIPALTSPTTPTFVMFVLPMLAPQVSQTQLIEVNVTSDIVDLGQPYAAFASWHYDADQSLPWLTPAPANFPPAITQRWLHGAPMRYMVYPK